MATNENLPPNVIKQLAKELKNLHETPPEGIKVVVNEDNFSFIHADIEGPGGTPYEGGVFRMKLILSHDFPNSPPKGCFLTKIFHPNVGPNGEICVNALKNDWTPGLGLRHVLMVIRCLLIEPFPESALNEKAGKMLLSNYEEYASHARIYTGIHALKTKAKVKAGAISESITALNVDQTNTSMRNGDEKNTESGQITSPLGSNGIKGGNSSSLDQGQGILTSRTEIGVSASSTVTQKREVSFAKVQVDKKKIDARKKSLKRL